MILTTEEVFGMAALPVFRVCALVAAPVAGISACRQPLPGKGLSLDIPGKCRALQYLGFLGYSSPPKKGII